MNFDTRGETFYFEKSLSIDAINNETLCIDRKAHLFWEIPNIDAKIKELMSILYHSGKALSKLVMTGDSKDGKFSSQQKRWNKKWVLFTNWVLWILCS